jgi:hypothetical protein
VLYRSTRRMDAFVSRVQANWQYADQARWLLFVLFYAIAANVPYWAASRWLGLLPLGWFCIEYAVVGLLAFFLPRIVTAGLLLLVSAADLTTGVSKTYYLAPTECLRNFASLYEFPMSRLLAMGVVGFLIFFLATAAVIFPIAKMRGIFRLRAAFCLVAFICSILAMDYVAVSRDVGHFSNPLRSLRPSDTNRYSSAENMWLGRYPAIRLTRDQKLFGSRRSLVHSHISDFASVSGASTIAINSIEERSGDGIDSRPNLVVILLESWGIDLDTSVRDLLIQPYSAPDLLVRYRVSQGTALFYGSTVSGEARELCNSKIGVQILSVSSSDARVCLPGRLAAAGYHSISVHGMDGHMFQRSDWYDTIGFQEKWFRDSLRQQGLPDCVGAFTGICDASIARWIGDRLDKKQANPDFVYWVTLNSHLPVRVPSALSGGASCSVSPSLATQPALCSWYQLVENVHRSVAQLAMTSLARPTIFVVVGDHAPPFANPKLRGQFSSTDVPYIVLSPRRDIHPPMMQAAKTQPATSIAGPS